MYHRFQWKQTYFLGLSVYFNEKNVKMGVGSFLALNSNLIHLESGLRGNKNGNNVFALDTDYLV